QTAGELVGAVEALGNGLLARLTGAWQQAQGGTPAPQAPQQNAWQGQQQYPQAAQPPNQGYPGQPAWQTQGAPQGQFPQQGGGGQQGNRGPKPRPNWPEGVFKLNVPYQAKDAFKGWRQQAQGIA